MERSIESSSDDHVLLSLQGGPMLVYVALCLVMLGGVGDGDEVGHVQSGDDGDENHHLIYAGSTWNVVGRFHCEPGGRGYVSVLSF